MEERAVSRTQELGIPKLTLKRKSVLVMLFLTIIIFGFYIPYHYRQLDLATRGHRSKRTNFNFEIIFLYFSLFIEIIGELVEFAAQFDPDPSSDYRMGRLFLT